MALAGFEGCSVGHKYPTDPAVLQRALDLRGLRVSEPWASTYFTINDMEEQHGRATSAAQLEFIKAMGGTDMVVAELGGAVHPRPVPPFANKPIFDDEQWAASRGPEPAGQDRRDEGHAAVLPPPHGHRGDDARRRPTG